MISCHDTFSLKIHTHKFLPFSNEAFLAILKFYDVFFPGIKNTKKYSTPSLKDFNIMNTCESKC